MLRNAAYSGTHRNATTVARVWSRGRNGVGCREEQEINHQSVNSSKRQQWWDVSSTSFVPSWSASMNWDREKCSLYRVAGCPLFRGCLKVNEMTVRTCGIVRYIVGVCCWGVSVKQSSTVLIYVGLAGSIDSIPYPRVYYLWWWLVLEVESTNSLTFTFMLYMY